APAARVPRGPPGGARARGPPRAPPVLTSQPPRRPPYCSEVTLPRLPRSVSGVRRVNGRLETVDVPVKDAEGDLLAAAIPRVPIVKDGNYLSDDDGEEPARQVDIAAWIEQNLDETPLA